jgi:hypothetical protein
VPFRPPNIKQALCFLQPIGLDVGSQQGELDQVVLCAAAANAFVLTRQRRQRRDRAGKILSLERPKAARQCGKVRARGVTPPVRQFLYLPGTGIARGIISHDRLSQDDVEVGAVSSEPVSSFEPPLGELVGKARKLQAKRLEAPTRVGIKIGLP